MCWLIYIYIYIYVCIRGIEYVLSLYLNPMLRIQYSRTNLNIFIMKWLILFESFHKMVLIFIFFSSLFAWLSAVHFFFGIGQFELFSSYFLTFFFTSELPKIFHATFPTPARRPPHEYPLPTHRQRSCGIFIPTSYHKIISNNHIYQPLRSGRIWQKVNF